MSNDVIALAIRHIRATGPVSLDNVADYLLDQSSEVLNIAEARRMAARAVNHGLAVGSVSKDVVDGDVVFSA